jgi:hypothetical protein
MEMRNNAFVVKESINVNIIVIYFQKEENYAIIMNAKNIVIKNMVMGETNIYVQKKKIYINV